MLTVFEAVDPLDGVLKQLRAILKLELFLDAGAIGLHGFDSQMKVRGDAARALSAPNQLKDCRRVLARRVPR